MNRTLANRLQGAGSWVHRWPEWVAWAGAAALLLAALLSYRLAPQWQAQAQAQLAIAQRALQAHQPAVAMVRSSVGSSGLQSALPLVEHTPARRASLVALARRHGVEVLRASERADSAGQLQLALAGQTRYAALRAFVAAALLADPALVLERLRMQRATAAATELDFELQWTFLQRAEPAKASATPGPTRLARAGP